MLSFVCGDSVAKSGVMDADFPGNVRDGARPVQHHADRFVFELLRVRFIASQLPFLSEHLQL